MLHVTLVWPISRNKKMQSQLKEITQGQGEVQAARDKEEWLSRLQAADSIFDQAKDLTELGQTKNLKRMPDGTLNPHDPAVAAREQIFTMAVKLMQGGQSWESSMRDAMRWYYRIGRQVWPHEIVGFLFRDQHQKDGPTLANFWGMPQDSERVSFTATRNKETYDGD